jgi:hypothetical protein
LFLLRFQFQKLDISYHRVVDLSDFGLS